MADPAERRDWTRVEVEATVADYLQMLELELRDEPFNKAERNRNLRRILDGRSHGAVERKHQNISAILIEEGLPYVAGYKPLRNYQDLLRQVVLEQSARTPELVSLVRAEIERVPAVPTVTDILERLVDRPPERNRKPPTKVHELPPVYGRRTNYLLLEARNSALGRAGEEFVLNFERAKLLAARQDRLAGKVEHVSTTRGDGLGYDILSFTPDGQETLIEVKTTGFGEYTPFFVTRNELGVSKRESHRFNLYRVFAFRRAPQLFVLPGAVDNSCELEANQYVARVG
jgi:hypothetical protein